MSQSLFIVLAVLLVVGLVGSYLVAVRRKRWNRIAQMLAGLNLLADWTYSPEEWRRAVEDEFTWVKNKDSIGHVYISPTAIYVKNDFQDRLVEFGRKVVTHASYRGTEGSVLKMRVRWRTVRTSGDDPDKVRYFKEDYRIPVPLKQKEEANRVAEYFTAELENNLEAYAAVVPEDQPISLFGKDEF
jgi:hypothetical protein